MLNGSVDAVAEEDHLHRHAERDIACEPLDLPVKVGELDFQVGLAGGVDDGLGRGPWRDVAQAVACAGDMDHNRTKRMAAGVLERDLDA